MKRLHLAAVGESYSERREGGEGGGAGGGFEQKGVRRLGRHVAQQAGHGAEGGRGAEEAQHVLPLDEA